MTFDRPFRLRLIHFNDLHGRLADVTPDDIRPVFSRIAGFIRRAREECAGRSDCGVLVLSGGDGLVGSPFSELSGSRPQQFRCHPSYRLYSAAGIDASVIGNHDLDWGLGMLSLAAARDASFPLLSANLIPALWANTSGISPYAIVKVNGLRVGVIGVTTPGEIKHVHPREFEIVEPVAAVLEKLPAVRRKSDVVLVLSHLGKALDEPKAVVVGAGDVELAAALPEGACPAIVGSHTHSVLNEQRLETANIVNGVAILQAGSRGQYLGDVEIDIRSGAARVVQARLWNVDDLPEDAEFEQEQVRPLARSVQQLLSEPLGVAGPHEDLGPPRGSLGRQESALANFLADGLAARCRAAGFPVDFALVDGSTLASDLPAGPLTFGDLFKLMPYGDSIDLVRLPVGDLQRLLDDNARRVSVPGEGPDERGFLQFSREVRYRIERNAASFAERGNLHAVGATLNRLALDQVIAARSAPLLVGCSSFLRQLASGWERRAVERGLRLFDLNALPHEVTGLALREELVAHVRQIGGVTEAGGLMRDGRVSGF